MRHRRHQQPPAPPPISGIAIDGANVTAGAPGWTADRLQTAVRWFRSWRPDLPITVFLDASTLRRCDAGSQAELRRWAETGIEDGAELRLCERHEVADVSLLQHARRQRALVVSNDRFFDHEELRRGAITVQFTLAGDQLEVFAEATWFRPSGGAQRVAMAALQALRADRPSG